jgi:hypothetical protein
MQSAVHLRLRWPLLAMALVVAAGALAANAQLSTEVPAEKWRALRLKGLPKDGSVAIRVETSGPINVVFVHQDELERFPKPLRPQFSGHAERRLSFKISVPIAGNYYVILDNRKGDASRAVRLFIEALPARRPQPNPPKAPLPRDAKAI